MHSLTDDFLDDVPDISDEILEELQKEVIVEDRSIKALYHAPKIGKWIWVGTKLTGATRHVFDGQRKYGYYGGRLRECYYQTPCMSSVDMIRKRPRIDLVTLTCADFDGDEHCRQCRGKRGLDKCEKRSDTYILTPVGSWGRA
jgi:hypothetical protein